MLEKGAGRLQSPCWLRPSWRLGGGVRSALTGLSVSVDLTRARAGPTRCGWTERPARHARDARREWVFAATADGRQGDVNLEGWVAFGAGGSAASGETERVQEQGLSNGTAESTGCWWWRVNFGSGVKFWTPRPWTWLLGRLWSVTRIPLFWLMCVFRVLLLQGSYLLAASNDFASRIWTVDDYRLRVRPG